MTIDKDNGNNNGEQFEMPDFFGSSSVRLRGKRHFILTISIMIIIFVVTAVLAGLSESPTVRTDNPVRDAVGWETLRIDGNRNGKYVDFDHEAHKVLAGKGENGCRTCHHLSRPHDGPSSCYQCHMDMEKATSIFDHNYHAKIHSKNACRECHTGSNKSGQDVKSCSSCHEEYTNDMQFYKKVRGYKPAMHANCMGCHEKEDEKLGEKMLSDCSFCHGKNY
jgi:hypothetical protein